MTSMPPSSDNNRFNPTRVAKGKGRCGPETGAAIYAVIEHGDLEQNSARGLAKALELDESWVRKVCRRLCIKGILVCRQVKNMGSRPVNVYEAVKPQPKT